MLSLREMKTGGFAQYSRCFGLDGLEVMSARWMNRSFAPHMHDFYTVSLNYWGRGAFDCRSELRDSLGDWNLSDNARGLVAGVGTHSGNG
jgi:hypothetical protein